MRTFRRWPAIGAAGLGLLGAPCVGLMGNRPAPLPPLLLPPGRSPRCTPSLIALRESAYWRTQAVQSVADACDEEREQLLRWDPQASFAFEARRRQLLEADATGSLRRAYAAAARAAALACGPRERGPAARQLAVVDSDLRQP